MYTYKAFAKQLLHNKQKSKKKKIMNRTEIVQQMKINKRFGTLKNKIKIERTYERK